MKGDYRIINNITGERIELNSIKAYNEYMRDVENNFQEVTSEGDDTINVKYIPHEIKTKRYFENDVYKIRTWID